MAFASDARLSTGGSAPDLGSQILIGGVGTQKASTAPDGNTSVTWTATYGYIWLNAAGLGLGSMITDGMNSAGLAITTNPVGVLTNEPPFTWHLSNIANHVNLKATDTGASPLTAPQTGHGSGMLGLPGDSTPPSRFIRALLEKQYTLGEISSTSSAADVGSLALHVLNTVDIHRGAPACRRSMTPWKATITRSGR